MQSAEFPVRIYQILITSDSTFVRSLIGALRREAVYSHERIETDSSKRDMESGSATVAAFGDAGGSHLYYGGGTVLCPG